MEKKRERGRGKESEREREKWRDITPNIGQFENIAGFRG